LEGFIWGMGPNDSLAANVQGLLGKKFEFVYSFAEFYSACFISLGLHGCGSNLVGGRCFRFTVFSSTIFFVVIGVVNPFHKHFAVVNFGRERLL